MSNDVLKLLQLSCFRRPNINVAPAISARALLHADHAATSADIVEKADLAEGGTAWKAWAQKAGESSAAMAHKYVKQFLSISKSGRQGCQQSRADILEDEVEGWSKLWKEGTNCPKIWFGEVPYLPLMTDGELVESLAQLQEGHVCSRGPAP